MMETDLTTTVADTAVPSLSLCMIVKNEEFFLARCLDAVKGHVDEIIIVDTGSTDATRDIAADFTDKVYDFEWIDDFAAARNFSVEQASGDWILVLDADELISEQDLDVVRAEIRQTSMDAFFLIQYNYNNDNLVKGWVPVAQKTVYTGDYAGYRRNPIGRLFRNRKNIYYDGAVHEVIDAALEGLRFATLEVPIHHHMDDNPQKRKEDRQLNYLRMIERKLEQGPDGRLAASAGAVCMYYKHDYAQAIKYFQQAVELDYNVDESREGLAEAHYRLEQFPEASAIYTQLYQSGYASFSLCTNLANLSVRGGQYHQASQLLKLALSQGELGDEVASRIKHNISYLEAKTDSF